MAQCLQHLSDLAQFAGRWGGAGCSSGPGCSFSIALCSRLGGSSKYTTPPVKMID